MSEPTTILRQPLTRARSHAPRSRTPRDEKPSGPALIAGPFAAFFLGALIALIFAAATRGASA
jgi:hypothetical protein